MLKGLSQRGWVAFAAIAFALGGLFVIALLLGRDLEAAGRFYIWTALAFGTLGALGWRWLMGRGTAVSVWRGAGLGIVIGLLAHPIAWGLELLFSTLTGADIPFLEKPLNLLTALLKWPALSVASMVGAGWVTAAVGGLIGGVLGYLQAGTLRETDPRSLPGRIVRAAGAVLAVLMGVLLLLGLVPISTVGLTSRSNPAGDYSEALTRLEAIKADEATQPLLSECRTTLMTRGAKTDKVVVFYHGLTNCPAQFVPLGQQFFDRGYNVLIARFPYHVFEGRDVAGLNPLTAEAYRDMADASIDIARGLGDEVYVVGLSGGGTVAAWLAQQRNDVERVVLVAPFFGSGHVPVWLNRLGVGLQTRLPPINTPNNTPIPYAYQGSNTRAQGETMRLGEAVWRQSDSAAPLTTRIAMLINDNDRTVSKEMAQMQVDAWAAKGVPSQTYAFAESLGLPHDLIDIHQPSGDVDRVYLAIFDLVEGREPSGLSE